MAATANSSFNSLTFFESSVKTAIATATTVPKTVIG